MSYVLIILALALIPYTILQVPCLSSQSFSSANNKVG